MYPRRARERRVLGVTLLIALVVLALSACGGGAGGKEQANKPRHLPEIGSFPIPMHPGKYRSEEFEPSFSFHVGKGWKNDRQESSDKLAISRGGEDGPVLIFRNVQEVYNYDRSPDLPEVVKAPKDMVGWFQHHPYLDTEKPEPTSVGGVKGVQFDYVVSEDWPYEEITLFKYTDGDTADQGKDYKFRAIILEGVKGKTVTIGLGASPTDFDEFLAKSQKVLDSVKWTGS